MIMDVAHQRLFGPARIIDGCELKNPRKFLHFKFDHLSINNNHFHFYVDSIYTNELDIKGTTECSTSTSHLDVLLKLDINGQLMTQLYDKRGDFNFSIVNFP
jgi:hypothetical protein